MPVVWSTSKIGSAETPSTRGAAVVVVVAAAVVEVELAFVLEVVDGAVVVVVDVVVVDVVEVTGSAAGVDSSAPLHAASKPNVTAVVASRNLMPSASPLCAIRPGNGRQA